MTQIPYEPHTRMLDTALHIKARDWLFILVIGMVLSGILAALTFVLLGQGWLTGALYGCGLGFLITFFALNFVSFMNYQLLPKIPRVYWLPIAVFFSFMSGFLATLLSIYLYELSGYARVEIFHSHPLAISISVGVISYIVAALLYRFVHMRNIQAKSDEDLTQSRLRSLETQLNPHFLFNALNSIAELIHQDQSKAEAALLKVSAFLRSTMKEEALIPLEKEIVHVQAYIELENIRFNEMIRLHLEGAVPPWLIPKFSLQLLVENAIKHGFGRGEKPLDISMAFEDGSIIVQNNGAPMFNPKFGIGLNNLDQRLRLLNGGSLQIVHTNPSTFKIILGKTHENTDR